MIVTDETKANAQAIVDYLLMNPEKHEQRNFIGVDGHRAQQPLTTENFCGTQLCIAGTALFLNEGIEGLNRHILGDMDAEEYAAGVLGLNYLEAGRLFYTMNKSAALDATMAIAAGDEAKFNSLV